MVKLWFASAFLLAVQVVGGYFTYKEFGGIEFVAFGVLIYSVIAIAVLACTPAAGVGVAPLLPTFMMTLLVGDRSLSFDIAPIMTTFVIGLCSLICLVVVLMASDKAASDCDDGSPYGYRLIAAMPFGIGVFVGGAVLLYQWYRKGASQAC